MRLIDADEMLKRLQEWNTQDKMDQALYNFTLNRILEQPTIRDVDKVIESLKNENLKNERINRQRPPYRAYLKDTMNKQSN